MPDDETGAPNPDLEKALEKSDVGVTAQTGPNIPLYRVDFIETKIPVSREHGKVWLARRDAAVTARKTHDLAWEECIKYYMNDQTSHRRTTDGDSAGNESGGRLSKRFHETENIVFANVSTMLPVLYAKNPRVEYTAEARDDPTKRDFATLLEHLVNALVWRRHEPGLAMKRKARRAVLTALLTNCAWAEVGYTQKDDSSEEAFNILAGLGKQLEKAKSTKKIIELEGKISAIMDTIDLLTPAGPSLKIVSPFNMLVDPDSLEQDHSDANWMMKRDYIATSFLNAKYSVIKSGERRHVYKPTHVMKIAVDNDAGQNNNFTLFTDDQEFTKLGFASEEAYKNSQRTMVWFIWDKVLRRIYMFHNDDWEWPIWVWDDPLQLPRFFPFHRLSFHEAPLTPNMKGEVTYYLDQQDAINEINDEFRKARQWARRNIIYDMSSMSPEDVERVLSGDDGKAKGIKVPEGKKISDVLFSFVPPSMQWKELFDKTDKLQAIDRISSVNDVMRGSQFKTNTTNKAIENYDTSQRVRLDERIDQIEDWLSFVLKDIGLLCMRFMSKETVAEITGNPEATEQWQNMEPRVAEVQLPMRAVAGSTQKPTGAAKKEEAMRVGQILGQFAKSAPAAVFEIILKLFEQAFDEIVITDEDWKKLREQMLGMQGAQGAPPNTQGQGAANGAQQSQGDGVPDEEAIRQQVAQLDDAQKAQIQQLMQQGMAASEALQRVMQPAGAA